MSFISAEPLLDDYRPLQFTLIFMDIYMNGITGVEAVKKIREIDNETLTGRPFVKLNTVLHEI